MPITAERNDLKNAPAQNANVGATSSQSRPSFIKQNSLGMKQNYLAGRQLERPISQSFDGVEPGAAEQATSGSSSTKQSDQANKKGMITFVRRQ
jgi:hypothetical protein